MVLLLAIVVITGLLPVVVWLMAVPEPWLYLDQGVPRGQFMYVISKLAGLIAVALLTVQLSLALFRFQIRRLSPSVRWPMLHQSLGAATFIVMVMHIGLFIAAASVRSDETMLRLLLPHWQGFYNSMVSLGVLAFYIMLAVIVLGQLLRRRIITKNTIHKSLAFLCAVLVCIHSYAIGSETHSAAIRVFYGLLAVLLVASVASRFRLQQDGKGNSA